MKMLPVYALNDITIVKARQSYVWDNKGKKYLDMYGGHAVISIGHSHKKWVKGIVRQMKQISFYSNSVHIPLQEELANKMGAISGKNDYQLFLCNSGAEANENALKLASFHTGKKKIVSFTKAFHGRTSLAVAATDGKAYIAPVNETDNVVFLPFNDVAILELFFKQHGDEVAAVIVEGIQGVAGIIAADNLFLQTIRSLCDAYNAVYIADAVQCGCGRTGVYYSHDAAGVSADIYTMAKGIGNGFPVGAISVAPSIEAKRFQLGTTFGGNHLACASAIAVIDVMQKEKLMDNALQVGNYLLDELRKIEALQNVRGRGLMIGFDVPDWLSDLRNNLLKNQHIFTGEAKPNVIRLLPSLALTKKQADHFLKCIKTEIKSIQQKQ